MNLGPGAPISDDLFNEPTSEFIGKVVDLSIHDIPDPEDDAEFVERIVLAIDNLANDSDPRTWLFTKSNHPQSKWARWRKKMYEESGYMPTSAQDIIGLIAEWQEVELRWDNNEGDDFVTQIPIPMRFFQNEEEARKEIAQQDEVNPEVRDILVDLVESPLTEGELMTSVVSSPLTQHSDVLQDIATGFDNSRILSQLVAVGDLEFKDTDSGRAIVAIK